MNKLFLAFLVLTVPQASGFWLGPSSKSVWRERAIAIDGADDDWRAQEKDDYDGLSVAFANDDRDLYLLLVPHTRWTREQLAGSGGQDLTLWFDPSAGHARAIGITLRAPAKKGEPRTGRVTGARVPAATAEAAPQPELIVGPMDRRGVLEARIPLLYFGPSRPSAVGVGIETTRQGARVFRDPSDPRFEEEVPIKLWLRVSLAAPPGPR